MSVKILYFSITGNVKRFVQNLNLPSEDVYEITENLDITPIDGEKYIIIAPTYKHELTWALDDLIDDLGAENCLGLMGSGNRNFADLYCFTVKDLSEKYSIPILYNFEYFGLDSDIKRVKSIINKLEEDK